MPAPSIQFAAVASALTADPRRAPRLARQAGFAGLQLDLRWGELDLATLGGSGQRELRRLFAAESQQIVGLRLELGARGFGPGADIDQSLDRVERAMQAARGLEAPLVCLDVGLLPEPPRPVVAAPTISPELAGMILLPPATSARPAPAPPVDAPDPEHQSQASSALQELGTRADRYSVIVALRCELSSQAALVAALKGANCPWFGIDLDPVAALRDDWDAARILSESAGQIRHVRGRDAHLGADRRTRPAVIGSGSVDWPELLASLGAADYRGWLTIDPTDLPDRAAAASAGLNYLKKL